MLKELNLLQDIINQAVNKIMKGNLELRKRRSDRPDFSKDLRIDEIGKEIINFSMSKDFYEDDLKYREFSLYGRYSESENKSAYAKLRGKAKENQFVYDIYINLETGEVICKSDKNEEFVYGISLPNFAFNSNDKEMTFKEASGKYDVAVSTLRHRQRDGRFEPGDTRKSGDTWLVTKSAMDRLYNRKEAK